MSGVWAQTAPADVPAQEQRRALERERAQREQLVPTPDVRLQAEPALEQSRLPADELPCFQILTLSLRGEGEAARQFNWLLNAIAGPQADDSPLGRCVGGAGINLVLKRAQDALLARGFVTTRVLAEPQDLNAGGLALTILPGRVRAVRFAFGGEVRGTAWNAVPIAPGDILNLRDVEQALENFKRVPTAEADIQIEPGELPGQSDLVISYKQALPFRLSLSADDSGSRSTGKYQGGVTVSVDNPLTLNDLLYVSFNGDLGGGLDGERGTSGRTAHYSIPYGYWLFSTTFSHNRYLQSVAGLNQTYLYRGTSSNAELKLSRLVYRDAVRNDAGAQRFSPYIQQLH